MTAKLIVTAGATRGAQFPLTDRIIFNIGSDRGSTVFLDDPKVSPNHCRLYKEDSKFTLFDVSGKGLSVNGKKVVKAVLSEGDVVLIGDTEIRFTTSDALQQAYSASAAAAPQQAAPAAEHGLAPSGGAGSQSASHAARWEGNSVGATPGEPRGYSRVWLQCVEGNDKGKTFDLSEGTVWVIGRGHSADVTVMDIKVSRAHSRIDRQGDTFYLNDLNSTNGTFLNGQQIDRQVLHRGDYVKVGYTILSFQYDEVPLQAPPPPPPSYAPPPPVYAPPPPMHAPPPQMAQAPQWAPPAAAPPPAWGAPQQQAPAQWAPPPAAPAAPAASWAPPPAHAGHGHPAPGGPAGAAEDDYRNHGVLNYDEADSGAMAGLPPARAPQYAPAPTPAAPHAMGGLEDDAPLDISALDDDNFGAPPAGAQQGYAPPAGAWAPPPAHASPPAWGAQQAPAPAAWGVPQGGPGMLPAPPQRGAPAWGDPGAGAAPQWGAPQAPPYPGGALPPPQRGQLKTSDMVVPNLDDDADLFGGGRGAHQQAPPAAWGAPPPAPAAWGAPPAAPGSWAPPPAAPGAWSPPPVPPAGDPGRSKREDAHASENPGDFG